MTNRLKFQPEFTDLIDNGGFDPNPANPNRPASLRGVDSQGRYVMSGFNPDDDQFVAISSSAWKIQVGVRYEF